VVQRWHILPEIGISGTPVIDVTVEDRGRSTLCKLGE
jgi:hypothetical protein